MNCSPFPLNSGTLIGIGSEMYGMARLASGAYLFLTPVLPSPPGGGGVSDWLLGWTPSPSPRRVGQGSGAEGAGKIFWPIFG